MTTINHEPDSYCLPLAQSTSHKPDKCCLRLLRSTYHGSHPWCVVLIITSIRTGSNSSNKFEHVRTLRVRFEQVRSRLCTSLVAVIQAHLIFQKNILIIITLIIFIILLISINIIKRMKYFLNNINYKKTCEYFSTSIVIFLLRFR